MCCQESRSNHSSAVDQLTALQEDRDKQIAALQETHRLAESRKTMLDDMANRRHADAETHRQQAQAQNEEHARTLDNLSTQMAQLKVRYSMIQPLMLH